MQAPNYSLSIRAGLNTVGSCSFYDVDGAPVVPPAEPAVWTLMDQYFNAPADLGVVSISLHNSNGLEASVQAIAAGVQGIKIEVPGVAPYYVLATVSPAPGPKPAATLIVTFSTPA